MTRFGLVLGLAVVVGMSAWGFTRGSDENPARAAEATAEPAEDTNHEAAVHRYRTGQSNHWRHVMIGRR